MISRLNNLAYTNPWREPARRGNAFRGRHRRCGGGARGRHIDTSDYIVVVNATKVSVTGNKAHAKVYYSHSGYPGGLKEARFEELLAKAPHRVIKRPLRGCCRRVL
jgi:ribosomal L13-like protein